MASGCANVHYLSMIRSDGLIACIVCEVIRVKSVSYFLFRLRSGGLAAHQCGWIH